MFTDNKSTLNAHTQNNATQGRSHKTIESFINYADRLYGTRGWLDGGHPVTLKIL